MTTAYERRVDWAIRKMADEAFLHHAVHAFGLRGRAVTEPGYEGLASWAAGRARELAQHAEEQRVPLPVLDAELASLCALVSAAVDVAAGGPLRRLERRIVPPAIPSGSTGAVRQAIAAVALTDDADVNLQRLLVALRGAAPNSETGGRGDWGTGSRTATDAADAVASGASRR